MKNPFVQYRTPAAPVVVADVDEKKAIDKEAGALEGHVHSSQDGDGTDRRHESDSDAISATAQEGVQRVEAMTMVWTKKHVAIAYLTIWLIFFVDAMQQGMATALTPYVTSEFALHSLTATTGIIAYLIGGLIKLPLAKVLDIWGRPQGFILMVACLTLGLIMMAACQNVQTYAAAQVFYWVGYNGISYSISVFIADTSALKNRALMFAFASSPYIITVWVTGPLATAFLEGPGFRWGFGAFAIITPVICTPLLSLFYINYKKAHEAGLIPERVSRGNFWQTTWYYIIQFDLFGMLLIAGGLALFLLSFNIYTYQTLLWKAPLIICFLIFGGLLMIAFVFYEKYVAPVTFIPYELLMDRTVLSACILSAALFVSFYIWDSYFYSLLQVVYGLSVTHSSYIVNIYSIGSCFWSLVVGALIRYTGRFKWIAVYFGVPVTILGVGLMINFRQPDVNIGYVIMCQIFIALSGGALVICEQMAVMAVTSHQYIAVVLAIEAMFASIGGAIGSTIAGAIWQGVFPKRLYEYLPAESKDDYAAIYGSITVQMSYPFGSDTRHAINQAYGDSQKYMLIAATAVQAVSVVCVLLWRDVKVKDFKQVKGVVV
ncbi:major facilitator superfamily domain-containing protein [Lasiosphaeria miniovina]|uniref:Major facilitator superfamily domain-containing protein n=1 Tax=Lasiosphaeria miniovina TaxID=1954250 RepID=A0AA40DUY5_9PEZI|nr:major facilitator superfamily domain-containing protein [Lasiosphaeria miniovina]KAK0712758.1 major facilitator superfamily domain-containing protein [Lasiosphaeria miniovina]